MNNWLKKIRISNNAVFDEQNLWLVSNYTNVLMNYDIQKGDLKQVYYFPEKFSNTYATISYEKVADKIYFAPYNGQDLWCFDISKKEFETIDLELNNEEKNIKQKFRGIVYYKNELILIGFGIHSIFRIDLNFNTVKRCNGYLVELEKKKIAVEETFLGYSYQLVGDILYLPMLNQNIIIAFHLISNTFKLYDILDLDFSGLDSIEYYNGRFRLLSSGNEEVIWDCESGQQSKNKLNFREIQRRNYWRTFQNNDVFIYFPLFDPQLYIKNKEGNIEELFFMYPEVELFSDASKYEFIKENNGKIYFQVRSNGDCFCVDLEQMLINPIKLKLPDDNTYEQILKKIFATLDEEKLYESEIVNIMNSLCFLERFQRKKNGKSGNYGEMIYRSLK